MIRTHIDRLSEYYQQKESYLDLAEEKEISTRRLLVIDDEPNIRNAYRRILLKNGFDVFTASNAMEANEILACGKIDIVLLDINMPEVDGTDLFEVIRMFNKNTRVIVSSVYPIDEQKEKIKDADAYFDKSDSKEDLVMIVNSFLKDF